MKDTTVVILALVVASIIATALIIPQMLASQSYSSERSTHYRNRSFEANKGMIPGDVGRHGMMRDMLMMKGMMGYYSGVPTPLSHDDAKAVASRYLASLNNPDFAIDEFEEYSHNFYISIIEKSTRRGVIEIVINRYDGALQAEPQSMMWSGRYGVTGGSRGAEMTVTPEQAMRIAQDFLDIVFPRTKVDEIVAYYGYYTIMTTLNGEHYGMLSINGYSGEIWYHSWHGMFISEAE